MILETLEDYENAPNETIALHSYWGPITRVEGFAWVMGRETLDWEHLQKGTAEVLRWGEGGMILETFEDYQYAPQGTVIESGLMVMLKLPTPLWIITGGDVTFTHEDLAGKKRRVLRWGKENNE